MVENRIPEDLAKAVEFHGHLCPGLVIGYLAAKVGLDHLGANRSQDEELIAIVENDSCAIDAVQVLTGCTAGKANLILRDYGKMVFTFAVRPTGHAVRVSLKYPETSDIEQAAEGSQEHRDREIKYMLQQPPSELFSIRQENIALPDTAQIHQSVICQRCGEMVMETRTRSVSESTLCVPCAKSTAGNTHGTANSNEH